MTKFIAILIIHGSQLVDDILDLNIKYLIDEIALLNYHVNKVSVIQSGESLIIFEISNLLKQNDFVLLIDKVHTSNTFRYLDKVFNFEKCDDVSSFPQYSKLLIYDNHIKLQPIVYLARIFVIQDMNIKLVFDNILKRYLHQFNKEKRFVKNIKLSSANSIHLPNSREDGIESKVVEEESMVQLQSSDLNKLIDYQKHLQKGFSKCCSADVYFLEDYGITNKHCFSHIIQATEYIEKCLTDHGLDNVFVSFNGGKDCTVLLHLVLGVLRNKYPEYKNPVVCMYVQSSNPFSEVNHFIDLMRHYYNLDIVTITKGVREGLEEFLETRKNMKACLMGTRRSDPFSKNLEIFQMTDPNWPQVMRVSPLLNWHYSEIWDYLLFYQVPYCSLYDEGYTSLGSVTNTKKNPNLFYKMDKDNETYLPAYKLLDGNSERSGRV